MQDKKYPFLSIQGIGQAIKKKSKAFVEDVKREQALKREFEEKIKKARRDAYEKEAIKQAEIKARMSAKLKFNPNPQQKKTKSFDDIIKGLPQ